MQRTFVNRRALSSTKHVYDRGIFYLIIAIALGLCVNAQGLVEFIETHFPHSAALRVPAYAVAIASGAVVGLFSTRIASRITAWRDNNRST
jgi:nitrate reductase gamma subunit